MAIKITIYEDNKTLRDSLSFLVQSQPTFQFCGSYPNALKIIENCRASMPDIILSDIDMPGISGIEAAVKVKQHFPEVQILILTVYEDKDKIFDALCAGATGYLLKKSSSQQIIEAITDIYHGGSPMSGEIARKVLNFFSKPEIAKQNDYSLSDREMEILQRLVNGDSYKMITDKCFISIGTVRSHITNIYKKLQVNSKSEAVSKALKEKIV